MSDEEKEEGLDDWGDTLKEYVSQYVAEAKDIIPKIEEDLFAIEKREGDEREIVHTLFRSWHTIKGAAGFLGFDKTVQLAHKTESLIAKIRDENIPFTEDILNVIFDALEKLKTLTENISISGEEGDVDISEEVQKIDKILAKITGLPEIEEGKAEEKATKEGKEQGEKETKEQTPEELGIKEEEKKEETSEESKEEAKEGTVLGTPRDVKSTEAEAPQDRAEGIQERTEEKQREIRFDEGVSAEEIKRERKAEEEKKKEEERKDEEKRKKKFVYETIRVDTRKIDEVMALSEELILERNFLLNIFPKIEQKYPRDEDVARLSEVVANVDKIISMLRFSIMKMRMVPIKMLFSKFPGTVRNLARLFGKKVELIMSGEETELDRSLVDELEEPMIHIIRNSIDHGIEKPEERIAVGKPPEGKITLAAYYEGDNVVIEVEDDGRGIDPDVIREKAMKKGFITPEQANSMTDKDIINLIFLPGFSSKDKVSELSGRGVGMDVVKAKVVELKGTLDIETEPGYGTKITIRLPLTVGIMNTIKVICNGSQFFIPLSSVIEITRISKSEIKYARGQPLVSWRDNMVPVVYLGDVYGYGNSNNSNMYHLIIAGVAEKRLGILVDTVISSEEIAVKTIGGIKATGIAGATISAEGEPVLVADVYSILKYLEEQSR